MADLVIDMTEPATDPAAASQAPVDHGSDVVVVPVESGDTGLPANATLQEDGSVVLTLRYPITMRWRREGTDQVREERRASLQMYRLNGAAMRAIMSAGQGHTVTVGIAKSCRMAQALFDRLFDMMDGADAQAAAQVLNFFLSNGTPTATGQPSSP